MLSFCLAQPPVAFGQSVCQHHSWEMYALEGIQAARAALSRVVLASSLLLGFSVGSVLPMALTLCCLNSGIILFYRITF